MVDIDADLELHVALFSDGRLVCWGADFSGGCAHGTGPIILTSEAKGVECLRQVNLNYITGGVSALDGPIVWGSGSYQLVEADRYGVGALDVPVDVVRVIPSAGYVLLLTSTGNLWWQGQMVRNADQFPFDYLRAEVPLPAPVPGVVVDAAAAGHSCAVNDVGELYCWGASPAGWHGHTGLDPADEPTLVPAPEALREVEADTRVACARGESGAVYCTGSNEDGLLGMDDLMLQVATLTPVGGIPPADSLLMEEGAACITSAGELWCWGVGRPGSTSESFGPVRISDYDDVIDVSNGDILCVLRSDRTVWCYGGTGEATCESWPPAWRQIDFEAESCQ